MVRNIYPEITWTHKLIILNRTLGHISPEYEKPFLQITAKALIVYKDNSFDV